MDKKTTLKGGICFSSVKYLAIVLRNIAIIEDDHNVRKVLTDYFSSQKEFKLVLSASSYEDFKENWSPMNTSIDLILCDIGLPGKSGIEATASIKEVSPETLIMIFTVFEDHDKIFQALCVGATGYMVKTTPLIKIKEGILDMLSGGAVMSPQIAIKLTKFFNNTTQGNPLTQRRKYQEKLTSRELEVLALLQTSASNKEIAEKLFVSLDTIKYHIRNIYTKLHVTCRKELFLKFRDPFH